MSGNTRDGLHISTAFLVGVCACLLFLSAAAQARLPEEGIKKAQEAEKLFGTGKSAEAINVLTQLAHDFPNELAVNLRLGQMYDSLAKYGEALFYYRRYARLAGSRAIPEAQMRLYTLEQAAGAKLGADDFAKKQGETSEAVVVPTPKASEQIAKLNPDGSLTPLKGVVAASAGPVANQSRDEAPVTGDGSAKAGPVDTTRGPARTPYVLPTRLPDVESTRSVKQTIVPNRQSSPEPEAVVEATPHPTPRKSAGKSNIQFSFESSSASAPDTILPEERPAPKTGAVTRSAGGTQTEEIGQSRYSKPRGNASADTAGGFFASRPGPGNGATITVTNGFDHSIMTFAAIPADGGDPVNLVLAGGETRKTSVRPGPCHVHVTIENTNYPAATLFNREVDAEFKPGFDYSRTFSEKSLGDLN